MGKKRSRHAGSTTLAVGTHRGMVALVDMDHKEVRQVLGQEGKGHSTPVGDVAFSADGSFLYSCSPDEPTVLRWSIKEGTRVSHWKPFKHSGVTRLLYLPASADASTESPHLLVARNEVLCVDADSGTPLCSLPGHSGTVCCMSLSPDASLLVTGCSDRILCLWSVADLRKKLRRAHKDQASHASGNRRKSAKQRRTNPLVSVTLSSPATSAALHESTASASLLLSLTHADGSGSVRRVELMEDASGKVHSAKCPADGTHTLRCQHPDDAVLATAFPASSKRRKGATSSSASSPRLLVAHGLDGAPVLETIDVVDRQGDGVAVPTADTVLVSRPDAGKGGDSAKHPGTRGAKAAVATEEGKVAHREAMESSRPQLLHHDRMLDDDEEKEDDEASDEASDEPDERAAKRQRTTPEGDGETPSLGERLRELTRTVRDAVERDSAAETHDDDDDDDDDDDAPVAPAGARASTASMISVLEQALQAGDDANLEVVLGATDNVTIQNTVSRLRPSLVLPFLKKLIARFEGSPGRGVLLSRWLHALLVLHAAQLLTTPRLVQHLSVLYQTVDSRLAVFRKLLRLNGRLDLLLSQVDRKTALPSEDSDPVPEASQSFSFHDATAE